MPKQEEVLCSLVDHRRVAVKSGNGLGKGFCAAVALLWFLYAHRDAAIALIADILSLLTCNAQVPFLDNTGGTAVVSEALTVGWARLSVCVGSPAWLETTGVK